jgi:hypothetical protein
MDFASEKLISLKAACRLFPSNKGKSGVAMSTLWRWMSTGYRGVKLESFRCGGMRFTSREAVQRFLTRINAPSEQPTNQPIETPAAQRRGHEQAEAALAAAGW